MTRFPNGNSSQASSTFSSELSSSNYYRSWVPSCATLIRSSFPHEKIDYLNNLSASKPPAINIQNLMRISIRFPDDVAQFTTLYAATNREGSVFVHIPASTNLPLGGSHMHSQSEGFQTFCTMVGALLEFTEEFLFASQLVIVLEKTFNLNQPDTIESLAKCLMYIGFRILSPAEYPHDPHATLLLGYIV